MFVAFFFFSVYSAGDRQQCFFYCLLERREKRKTIFDCGFVAFSRFCPYEYLRAVLPFMLRLFLKEQERERK